MGVSYMLFNVMGNSSGVSYDIKSPPGRVLGASGTCLTPTEVERRRTAADWNYVANATHRSQDMQKKIYRKQ